jgi:hypothetical protein
MQKLIEQFARLRKTSILATGNGTGDNEGKTIIVLESGHKYYVTEKELQAMVDELLEAKAKEPNFSEPIIEAKPKLNKKGDK